MVLRAYIHSPLIYHSPTYRGSRSTEAIHSPLQESTEGSRDEYTHPQPHYMVQRESTEATPYTIVLYRGTEGGHEYYQYHHPYYTYGTKGHRGCPIYHSPNTEDGMGTKDTTIPLHTEGHAVQ